MPYITYKDKRYLARWPESWDVVILKVAQRYADIACKESYCNVPYKCRDMKFSRCYYCHVGRLKRDGDGIVRHKSCKFKRSKISWRDARLAGDLDIIPLRFSLKEISTRYMQLCQAMLPEVMESQRIYKREYFHKNYKKCKRSAKGSRDHREGLFRGLPLDEKDGYPVGGSWSPRPDTPGNIRDRENALVYKKRHYAKIVERQCERNRLKTEIGRKFLEGLLLKESVDG